MPAAPVDQFAGAEGDISKQRRAALAAIAQFGRRGLEEGVIAARGLKTRAQAVDRANNTIADEFGVPTAMRRDLAGQDNRIFAPYRQDQALAQRQFRQETRAASAANATFYDQAAQAVPQLRAQGQQVVEQYRQAYEERQSQLRAEAEARAEAARQAAAQLAMREREIALQAQVAQEQLAAQQQIAAANLAAMQASRPTFTPSAAPAASPQRKRTMAEMGYNPRTGKWGR